MPAEITNFDSKNYNSEFIKGLYTEDFHNYHIEWFKKKSKFFFNC